MTAREGGYDETLRPRGAGVWGSHARTILALAAPLGAFFLIQSFVSLACLAMLGRLGNAVLAGVGAAGAIYGAALALLFGFDTAVQALVSRATGAGEARRPGEVLMDAWAASVPLGVALGAALWTFGPALLAAIAPDRAAAEAGSAYLRGGAPSLALLAVTVPINACWIGSGRPAISFLVTALTAPAQVVLTLVLVFGAGPLAAEGAGGAGVANSLTCLIGLCLQAALVARLRLVAHWRRPRLGGVGRIAAIGWPVSTQQSLSQLGLMAAFVIVAQLGTASTAIVNVLISLTTVTIQASVGFGVASATLVGQSLGHGDAAEARRWGWRATALGAGLLAPIGLAAALDPEPLLRLFLRDPHTVAQAVWPLRLVGLSVGVDAAGGILSFCFRGAGATKVGAGVPFVSFWLLQLPLLWWIGVRLGGGVLGLVGVQAALSVASALALAWLWAGGLWTRAHGNGAVAPSAGWRTRETRRIAILGGAGAGKSTLARKLGQTLGLPVIHMDRIVFGPGWARFEPAAVRQRLAERLGEAWIVEGTFEEVLDLTLPRADLVVWLDQPVWLRLWRTWRKTRRHAGRPRADRPDGCEESFGWSYASDVLTFGRWSGALERQLRLKGATSVLRLKGDRAAARFLAGER